MPCPPFLAAYLARSDSATRQPQKISGAEGPYCTFSCSAPSSRACYSACFSSPPSSRRPPRFPIGAALLRHFPSYLPCRLLADLLARADASPTAPPLRSACLRARSSPAAASASPPVAVGDSPPDSRRRAVQLIIFCQIATVCLVQASLDSFVASTSLSCSPPL